MSQLPLAIQGYMGAQDAQQQQQLAQLQMIRGLTQMQNEAQMMPLQLREHELKVKKMEGEQAMNAMLGPLMANGGAELTPQMARTVGMRMAIGGHPGSSAWLANAQRLEDHQNGQLALQGMQSSPGVTPVTAVDDEGNQNPAIAPKVGPVDHLLNSPYVGGGANALRAFINQGAPGATPAQVLQRAEVLQQHHNTQQNAADNRAALDARSDRRAQDRVDFRVQFPPQPRQERMLPVQMPDGTVQYVPQSEAAGQTVGKVAPPQNNSRQVQQLGQAFERAKVNEANATLGEVESLIAKNPKFLEYVTGPKALIPDNMVGPEITAGRQAFAKLFNITLKDRSGAAVTVPEYARLKEEYGKGLLRTPDQLATAVTQARTILNKHASSVAAGFSPDTVDSYNTNLEAMGGSPIVRTSKAPAAPAPVAGPAVKASPEKGEVRGGYEFIGGDPSKQMSWRLKK